MQFELRVADAASRLKTIHLEASDASDARQQAVNLRLTPVSVRAQTGRRGGRNDQFNLPLFAEELRMLLSAGLPLIDAIEGLADRRSGAVSGADSGAILRSLVSHLRHGERLSSALGHHPEAFPPLFVGIVRAAESTSTLPESLAKYAVYESHMRVLRERMASAAIYPMILLAVGSAVTLFLLTYVVPRFASVYQSSGRPLPWFSQAMLDFGQLLNQHWLVGLVLAIAAFLAGWRWYSARKDSLGWLRLLALLPGVASHVATVEVSRMYRTLGMLLEGGLPVREALKLADAVVSDARRQAVADVLQRVEGGEPLSTSLERAGLSTPLALRLIQVGERSGQLGAMLERAAIFHEHETALWIERFSKTFGPVLMILISLIVGAVVIFLYIPVFDLAGSLQ